MRKSVVAPPPPQSTNGNGSTSLSEDSDSTSGESLEGLVELSVMLPDGKCVKMSTEKRTPMMDLLVQVTKANGLSPGSFVLDVKSEMSRDSVRYKPSTPVGALNTSVVYVVAKSSIRDVSLVRKDTRSGNPPFEKTFRLRVHLPRNQLHVLRVSQTTPLIDVFSAICKERELNSSRYELRHPVHTEERLDPQRCLADYGLSEVAIVAVKGPSNGFSRSSSDIMSLQHDDDRKKHRFFGFMFKKSKSVSRSIGDNSSDGHSSRGVSPARSDGSGCQSISPPPSTAGYPAVNGASHKNGNSNKVSKKRAAPPPPRPVEPKQVEAESVPTQSQNGNELTATSHSRHSSDSSGYHEASILSDSMDTTGHDIENLSDNKASTPDAKKDPAPSNLTTINSTSMNSVTSGPKKRKAPAPPARSVSSTLIENGRSECAIAPPPSFEDNVTARVNGSNPPEDFQKCNGKSVRRKDSGSSHASSTSEEVRSVTAAHRKPPAPVPLPRQSKSPAPMPPQPPVLDEETTAEATESSQSEVSGLDGDVDAPVEPEQPVKRNPSFGETTSVGRPKHGDGAAEAFSDLHVVNLSNGDSRRTSSGSTVSTASSRKSTSSEVLREKQVPSKSSTSVESDAGAAASSRRSSVLSEASSHSIAIGEAGDERTGKHEEDVEQRSVDATPLSPSKKQEVSVQTNFDDDAEQASRSSVENGGEGSSGTSSRKSSRSESGHGEDPVQPESPGAEPDVADNVTFAVAPTELSSLDENRNSDALSDFPSPKDMAEENPDVKTLEKEDMDTTDRRMSPTDSSPSDNSPQNSPKSRKPVHAEPELREPRVKEADVTALSAQIDKSMSEHRIAAEIDEAFASIDSMETGSDKSEDDNETPGYKAQASMAQPDSDPVITWEYRIPEVPAQFQNDYEDKQDAQHHNETNETMPVQPVELVTPEVPPSSAAVPPPAKSAEPMEPAKKSETAPPKSSASSEQEEQEQILKRPVMSFSISTYSSRVEEEREYGRKLVKAEPAPIRKPQLTKSSSVAGNSTLPRPPTQAKPRVSEPAPGHSLSIAKALAKPAESEAEAAVPNNGVRRAKSEMHLGGQLSAPAAVAASGSTAEEQERLQQEYLKLHTQFLQWQQQLLHNQTVLQQQQILPETATETLQRIQELHQQFMSLPIAQQQQQQQGKVEAQSVQSANASQSQKTAAPSKSSMGYPLKTNSLPRPKSTFAMPPAEETKSDYGNSLERKLPRVGPRPWIARPVSMTLGSWKPATSGNLANPTEPTIVIESKRNLPAKTVEPQKSAEIVPRPVSIRDRVSSLNATNVEKPVPVVNRQPSQPSFPRCPVVKGFANVEPMIQQQKSRVIVNSAPKPKGTAVNGSTAAGQVKPGVVRVDVKPQPSSQNGKPVASTYTYFGDRVEPKFNMPKVVNGNHDNKSEFVGKITVNAMNRNNNNNVANNNKNFTTVVVNAAPSRQQSNGTAPPPPPPPPTSLKVSQAKLSSTNGNGQANRRSVSSPESDEDKRDELMTAIRGFGGRTGLKKVSSSETGWQNRHGNL